MDMRSVLIGVGITSMIFIFNNRKMFKGLLINTVDKDYKEREEREKNLKETMEKENVSREKAKSILFDKEIIDAINITRTEWRINKNLVIKQGDRVSFMDEEDGFVQGDFFGLIEPQAVGYGDLYVIKRPDNTIRQAPVVFVKYDTINVYNR